MKQVFTKETGWSVSFTQANTLNHQRTIFVTAEDSSPELPSYMARDW